jgi:hypothetical protein
MDNGGSLLYRAMGEKKTADELGDLQEWDAMQPGGGSTQYPALFKKAGISKAEEVKDIVKQIDAIKDLQNKYGGWNGFLDKVAPNTPDALKAKLASTLTARTQALVNKQADIVLAGKSVFEKVIFTYSNGKYYEEANAYSGGGEHWPLSHKDDYEANQWASKVFSSQANAFQKSHYAAMKKAVSYWKGSGYSNISNALFSGTLASASPAIKGYVKKLDEAFNQPEATLSEPVIVHRKFSPMTSEHMDKYQSLKPGDEITVEGFQAASIGIKPGYGHGGFMAHICLPIGAKALYVEGIHYGPGLQGGEREILLPRNTKYRVLSIKFIKGTWHQTWEAIL